MFRTDLHNNPTAFTTDIAREAGLIVGKDYREGDSFHPQQGLPGLLYTAKLLGDPIEITIRVIDKIGFYTRVPHARWTYIAIPYKLWLQLTFEQKKLVIGFMYQNEGGTQMLNLFT